jgi:hypothetical protein
MLAAAAGDPPPFMSMDMDASRYYAFIGDAIATSEAASEASSAEVNQAVGDIMQGVGKLMDRMSMNVNFTERGIEFPAVMTLND